MVSKTKLYTKLDSLEAELQERIVPHLKYAAKGNNDYVFCVKQFNSQRELKHKSDRLTEELIEIGSEIILLKEKLGESSQGSIAERICWYCRQWNNTEGHHRSSVKGLAICFLEEIQSK